MMYIMESPTVCVQACPGLPQCLIAVHKETPWQLAMNVVFGIVICTAHSSSIATV